MNIIEKRKQIKKNNIIKVIRDHEDVSRYVLKKKTKYSMTTILNSVVALIEEGLVTEEESTQKSVGRTPVYLKLNPEGRFFIGVEFNAERVKVSIVNFAVVVVYTKAYKLPNRATVEEVFIILKKAIQEALNQIEEKDKVVGIGIGVPGYVDRQNGIALQYSYFKDWNNVAIKSIIEKEFGLDVFVDNNINALAHHYLYEHREKNNFVIVSMQYGVRLGIVLNGEIFVGNSGNAGEIGHTKVLNGQRQCSCGKIGCLDSEISYLAIEQKIKEYMREGKLQGIAAAIMKNEGKFTMEMLGTAIAEGDECAKLILKDMTGHLGRKLSTVISVIDIEDIIALNVCDLDNDNFANQVYDTIKDNSLETLVESVSVECEIVDPYAAAKGAAIMILEEEYGFIKEI